MEPLKVMSEASDASLPRRSPPASQPSREKFIRVQRASLGPDWRTQLAARLDPRARRKNAERYDPLILELAEFHAHRRRATDRGRRDENRFSLIAQAEELNANSFLTRTLKLMVLANMSHAAMSLRSGIDFPVLSHWESLYFDARGQREAIVWMRTMVIDREIEQGESELAQKMKLALAAGSIGVELMLDTESDPPLDEADSLMRSRLRINLKVHRIADMPLGSCDDAVRHMKLHAQLINDEERLKVAHQKLELRCAESVRKHELAMERLRQAERRAQEQAAAVEAREAARVAGRNRTSRTSHPSSRSADKRVPLAASSTPASGALRRKVNSIATEAGGRGRSALRFADNHGRSNVA